MKDKINLVAIYMSEDYSVSNLISFFIKSFNDERIRNMFFDNGINILTKKDFEAKNTSAEEFLKKNGDSSMVLGIDPYGIESKCSINKMSRKTIGWMYDPHWFANFAKNKPSTIIPQMFSEPYDSTHLDLLDYVITPSSIYFHNINMTKYMQKIKDVYYHIDKSWESKINNTKFEDRENKIILSGEIHHGYKSRLEFSLLPNKNPKFNDIIHNLKHPGYKFENPKGVTGINYYNFLSQFKGAMVGPYVYPINFLSGKYIEVLMSGCLGFFEQSNILESQLGLKAFQHYIPIYEEGKMIEDPNYYTKWMSSSLGKEIAQRGRQHIFENFGDKQIYRLINEISSCYS